MPIIPKPTRFSRLALIQRAKLRERAGKETVIAQELQQPSPFKLSWLTALGIVLVSSVYFTDIFFKASHKCFWFDELFAVWRRMIGGRRAER